MVRCFAIHNETNLWKGSLLVGTFDKHKYALNSSKRRSVFFCPDTTHHSGVQVLGLLVMRENFREGKLSWVKLS